MGCIRVNAIMVVRDSDLVSNRLFKTNEQFIYSSMVSRTSKCGSCPGSVAKTRTYYVVEVDGKTYELDAAFVREVSCEGPLEEVTGRPEDILVNMAEPNPGFEHLVRDEVRNDAYWSKHSNSVFDLRRT